MNILIIDDDFTTLVIAKKALIDQNHNIFTAENGIEALKIIRNEEIQIVISDWNMPEMNGLELCKYLRSQPSINHLYFIMMTTRDSYNDKVAAIEAGANEFLSKPIEPTELLVRLRSAERILDMPTIKQTIYMMGLLAEAKDSDTGRHLQRIQHYSRQLALELIKDPVKNQSLPIRFPDLVFHASPGHDIGKISVPDHVLFKPNSLNDEEWTIMKGHTVDGANILDSFLIKFPDNHVISMARDIAKYHHERWDGSGYPTGLQGEEIPFCARIVALADVYDALTMKRIYKSAMPHEMARGIIIQSNATHFDPSIVQAFLAVENQFVAIHQNFNDSNN